MAATVGKAASFRGREHVAHTIFLYDHMTTAMVNPESKVNPDPATAPFPDHHGMPPRQRIYKEIQQKQASELTQEKSTALGNH